LIDGMYDGRLDYMWTDMFDICLMQAIFVKKTRGFLGVNDEIE